MPSWPTTLPCPVVAGYGYASDPGHVRSGPDVGNPRQLVAYDQRPRAYSVSWSLSGADLATAVTWLDTYGYDWFSLPLQSAESAGIAGADHTVRVASDLSVQRIEWDLYSLSTTLEQAAADESCSLVALEDALIACLDATAWPDAHVVDTAALALAWGADGAGWTRIN